MPTFRSVRSLDASANLEIYEMPDLCRPTVDRRIAEMRRMGWVGPATIRGVSPTCTP